MLKRLKLAIKLFWHGLKMENYEEAIEPYKVVGEVYPHNCDFHEDNSRWIFEDVAKIWRAYGIEPCKNQAEVCMSRLHVRLEFAREDHLHVCREHAKIIEKLGVL